METTELTNQALSRYILHNDNKIDNIKKRPFELPLVRKGTDV